MSRPLRLRSVAAELDHGTILQRQAETVQDEPRRLLSDSQVAPDFIRANAVLAVYEHPQRDQPLVQGNGGVLEDSAHLNGELLAAALHFQRLWVAR